MALLEEGQDVNERAFAHVAPFGRVERKAESLAALRVFRGEADLRDPLMMGRYLGVPSARALATAKAQEGWATIEAERAEVDGERKPLKFIRDPL
jgi:hypothetical protein